MNTNQKFVRSAGLSPR